MNIEKLYIGLIMITEKVYFKIIGIIQGNDNKMNTI